MLLAIFVLFLLGIGFLAMARFAYECLVGEFEDRVEVAKIFFPALVALVGGPVLIWRALTAHWWQHKRRGIKLRQLDKATTPISL
jgi:hypothetical protein